MLCDTVPSHCKGSLILYSQGFAKRDLSYINIIYHGEQIKQCKMLS